MGSYARPYLARYPVYTTESTADPVVTIVFRVDDKRAYERKVSQRHPLVRGKLDDDELETADEYSAPVEHVRRRLELMGFSSARDLERGRPTDGPG